MNHQGKEIRNLNKIIEQSIRNKIPRWVYQIPLVEDGKEINKVNPI